MSRDYKRKDYVYEKEEAALPEEPMEPETRNGIITGAPNVNIRSEPSKTSQALATVQDGTNVRILGETDMFKHVSYAASEKSPEILGYVHSDYCKEVDP